MEILSRSWRPAMVVSLLFIVACEGENTFGVGRSPDLMQGVIAGAVTADGVPLGGVRLILVGRDSTETNSQGEYRFEGLPVGTYTLTVRVPIGFVLAAGEEAVRTAAVAERGTASVNWRLQSSVAVDGRPRQAVQIAAAAVQSSSTFGSLRALSAPFRPLLFTKREVRKS